MSITCLVLWEEGGIERMIFSFEVVCFYKDILLKNLLQFFCETTNFPHVSTS